MRSAVSRPRLAAPALLVTVSLALPAALRAQAPASAPPPNAPRAQATPAPAFPDLKLTAAQRGTIEALTERTRAQQRALLAKRAKGAPLTKADHEALVALAQAHNAAYRAVLTPAQVAQLDAHGRAMDAHLRARGVHPRGAR